MKNTTVFYHFPCLDGFASYLAAKLHFGDSAEYVVGNYDKEYDTDLFIDKNVYLVDFSFKREFMDNVVLELANHVYVLDHHKTALEELGGLDADNLTKVLDMDRSGVGITWAHFFDTDLPKLFKHVQDRDLWNWKMEDTKAVTLYLESLDFDEKKWMHAMYNPSVASESGECLVNYQKMLCENVASFARPIKAFGWDKKYGEIPFIRGCPKALLSQTLHIMNQGKPFSACAIPAKEGGFFWSLRASEESDVDVSLIAKEMGGGGHKKAAGFKTTEPFVINE